MHSLDHVKSRLGLRDTAMRRHDARGDVDLLGRARRFDSEREQVKTSGSNGAARNVGFSASRMPSNPPLARQR